MDWVNKKNTRILIYGIDEKSVALKLRLRDSAHYKVVGFYIYGKNNRRRRLADLPIYYFETEEDFNYVIKNMVFMAFYLLVMKIPAWRRTAF